jgi:hypothetical protein
MMDNRNRFIGLLLFLCFWLFFSGCGSEEGVPEPERTWTPDTSPSCEMLKPLVLQDPLTGGAFHCLGCNREWEWTLNADNERVFVLIAVTCTRLASEAYLEIRDPQGVLVWQQPVEQGDDETYCIRYEDPPAGVITVGLYGRLGIPLAMNLLQEFRGSIYLKLFNERGDLLGFRNP